MKTLPPTDNQSTPLQLVLKQEHNTVNRAVIQNNVSFLFSGFFVFSHGFHGKKLSSLASQNIATLLKHFKCYSKTPSCCDQLLPSLISSIRLTCSDLIGKSYFSTVKLLTRPALQLQNMMAPVMQIDKQRILPEHCLGLDGISSPRRELKAVKADSKKISFQFVS